MVVVPALAEDVAVKLVVGAGEEPENRMLWALRGGRVTGDDDLNTGQVVANHLLESSFHFVSQDVESALWVVSFAVVPDELQVIEHLFNSAVLPRLQFVLHLE